MTVLFADTLQFFVTYPDIQTCLLDVDRQESELTTIDDTIRATLGTFVNDIRRSGWWGKEREAVSHFAFGFLVQACADGADLHDPGQIGIEVRVPRPPSLGSKEEITKDLVIWARRGETCWEAPHRSGRFPLAVMQWKVNEGCVSAGDVAWLIALTTYRPGCRGYALCLDLEPTARLRCDRIYQGKIEEEWLVIA